ncbi:MAG: hypothetical protein ACXACO_19730 [Promethearchaeota archaeon]
MNESGKNTILCAIGEHCKICKNRCNALQFIINFIRYQNIPTVNQRKIQKSKEKDISRCFSCSSTIYFQSKTVTCPDCGSYLNY